MIIELEVADISMAAKAINNAAAAYGRILCAVMLGCEVPNGFEALCELTDDECRTQILCLKDIIRQIDNIEET